MNGMQGNAEGRQHPLQCGGLGSCRRLAGVIQSLPLSAPGENPLSEKPEAPNAPDTAHPFAPTSTELRRGVLVWEGLRILFNIVLLAEGLLLSHSLIDTLGVIDYLAGLIAYGAVANAFYTLGPISELYAALLLRIDIRPYRYYIFGAGLLLSMVITAIGIGIGKMDVNTL